MESTGEQDIQYEDSSLATSANSLENIDSHFAFISSVMWKKDGK